MTLALVGALAPHSPYPLPDENKILEQNLIILGVGLALTLGLILSVLVPAISQRKRPTFSLKWLLACVLSASVALYGGVCCWNIRLPNTEELEWRASLNSYMETTVQVEIEDEPLPLNQLVLSCLPRRPIYVFMSPDFGDKCVSVPTKAKSVAMKEFIPMLCKQADADWDILYRAILIYPKASRYRPQERPIAAAAWEAALLGKLSRKTTWEMICTPFGEAAEYLGSLSNIRMEFGPQVDQMLEVNLCPGENMRLDDSLTWFCFLTKTEWSLKPTENGAGMIWIEPRKNK